MFENPRRRRQARNFATNVPKILDLKSSSEQIFSRKLSLGAPVIWEFFCNFYSQASITAKMALPLALDKILTFLIRFLPFRTNQFKTSQNARFRGQSRAASKGVEIKTFLLLDSTLKTLWTFTGSEFCRANQIWQNVLQVTWKKKNSCLSCGNVFLSCSLSSALCSSHVKFDW